MLIDPRAPAVEDPSRIIKVEASDGKTGDTLQLSYTNNKVAGNGSFGVVYQAKVISGLPPGQEEVAIKKVLQDKRFKVRAPTSKLSLILC